MLCNICKKFKATVHVTEIINNKMTELHLCETCAKKKSFQMEQHFGLADLLAGLSDVEVPLKEAQSKQLKCSNCNFSYENFRKVGRLGCSECYKDFKDNLRPLLKRIHRATKHFGSAPLRRNSTEKTLQEKTKQKDTTEDKITLLKNKLQKAVEEEAFEEAAKIRDLIKDLKNKPEKENN